MDEDTTATFSGRSLNYITVACFLEGTQIRTPAGERAVESLRSGDLVVTADGTAKAVKWIGHRSYEAEFGASEAFVRPVVFKAGSLGGGLPVRDLKVSPQHGMLIDGAMVPAAALVNGVSIVRDENPGDITYFHIEMEGHEAVFAEGALSETFVDHDSRAMFDNADEFGMLFGTAQARPVEQPREPLFLPALPAGGAPRFPLARGGDQLLRLRSVTPGRQVGAPQVGGQRPPGMRQSLVDFQQCVSDNGTTMISKVWRLPPGLNFPHRHRQ